LASPLKPIKSLRRSHLLDVRVKAHILRIGASLACLHAKVVAGNPGKGLPASKAFFKKDIRNGEG